MPDVRLGAMSCSVMVRSSATKFEGDLQVARGCRASRGDACLMRGRVDRRGASRFSDKHQARKEDLSMHELRGMP